MEAPDLRGKLCLITGASRGIGRVTAVSLARMGADLVLAVRDRARGEEVVSEIRKLGAPGKVELLIADLSSIKEVRRLAAEFLAKHDRLDVLVNNAGAVYMDRQVTVDGLERTFATNHVAYFLLTTLLLDVLKRSAPSRIVSVASDAHSWGGGIDFDDLQCERVSPGLGVYGRSKLANILFTVELARRLEGTGVTANCLHPGAIGSNFGQEAGKLMAFAMTIAKPFLKTPETGAKTSVYLASSPAVAGVSGKYFDNSRPKTPSKAARDAEAAKRLWAASEAIVAKVV